MPQGPQGQKRPADVIGNAVQIARIATGEIEDTKLKQPAKRASGLAGAKARSDGLTEADRHEIAKLAAEVRWNK
ncbi:MAG: histone H1 [Paracoccaceae bacterium]